MSAKRPKTGGRNRRKCRVRTAFLPQLREKKKKIRPKIKKYRQKQAKGDIIDKNSKRKRVGFAIAIYPREGTETQTDRRKSLTVMDCNLSPRGDGNRTSTGRRKNSADCNLSPRGDGNLGDRGDGNMGLLIAIYPREGTETENACLCKIIHQDCNLSPRGDGNL